MSRDSYEENMVGAGIGGVTGAIAGAKAAIIFAPLIAPVAPLAIPALIWGGMTLGSYKGSKSTTAKAAVGAARSAVGLGMGVD